jgi:hypothetical protein
MIPMTSSRKRHGIGARQWRNANYWLAIAEAREYLCFKFSDEVEWAPHDMASLTLDGIPTAPPQPTKRRRKS